MTRKARRPRPAPASEERRTHTISMRVNARERAELGRRLAATGRKEMGAYLRREVLEGTCKGRVPAVNITAYRELARTAANVNQLTRHLNEGGRLDATGTARLADEVGRLGAEVHALRLTLLGVADEGDGVGGVAGSEG